uniref:Uncharacterized protein n=1 Tax=Arcella intermedia TaxID=1963864 RepID=A0A6B2LTX4_9EUKA
MIRVSNKGDFNSSSPFFSLKLCSSCGLLPLSSPSFTPSPALLSVSTWAGACSFFST